MRDPRSVIIWCSGSAMIVDRQVAAALELEDGSRIETGSEKFWELLGANCQHQLSEIREQQRALRHGPS